MSGLKQLLLNTRGDHKTRLWLLGVFVAASDYFINVAILYAYAFIGSIDAYIPHRIALVSAFLVALFLLLIATKSTEKFSDPSLLSIQVFASLGLIFCAIHLAPNLALIFSMGLFLPLAYASLYLSRGLFFVYTLVISISFGVLVYIHGSDMGFAMSTKGEQLLAWMAVSVAFFRYTVINSYISALRFGLQKKNQSLSKATQQLTELASRDELTGLLNRRMFLSTIEDYHNHLSSGVGLGVAIVDVDHFKQVNDTYGHPVGDKVLQKLAQLLKESLREKDCVARFGGEEFAIVLSGTSSSMSQEVLERTRKSIENYDWSALAPERTVTVSIGISYCEKTTSIKQAISYADKALYISKNTGRNRVSFMAVE